MQGRSRMAAWAGVLSAIVMLAAAPGARGDDTIVVKKVNLVVRVAGLGRKGCDLEIKPGHPGCRFEKVTRHIGSGGQDVVVIKDLECRNADRDCSFMITVKEPGQADTTVRRGFRLMVPDSDEEDATPSFACFINAPSKVARAEAERARR